MWVLKLGGSLYSDDVLRDWVAHIAAVQQPLVIVPGGGPFADQVRTAQVRWGVDDRTAHAMALLAMQQFGLLLCGLHPRLRAGEGSVGVRAVLADGGVPVWMPYREVGDKVDIDADWRVTSDSLALWLVRELDADGIVLVKSAAVPPGPQDASAWQRADLVDGAFATFAAGLRCPIHLINKTRYRDLDALLSDRVESMERRA